LDAICEVELSPHPGFQDLLAAGAAVFSFEAAAEPPGGGEGAGEGGRVVDVVAAVDEAERHHGADDGTAGLAPEGDPGERRERLEDGIAREVEFLLGGEERGLGADGAGAERI